MIDQIAPGRSVAPASMEEKDNFDILLQHFTADEPPHQHPQIVRPSAELRQEALVQKALERAANADPPQYSNVFLLRLRAEKWFCPRNQNNLIYGAFSVEDTHYTFTVFKQRKAVGVYTCRKILRGLGAVLSYFAENEIVVILKGYWEDSVYYVTELHTADGVKISEGIDTTISDSILQAIVSRLVYCVYPDRLNEMYWHSSFPLGGRSLRLLFSALKPSLLPYQRTWVEHSFSQLSTGISRDETGHTIRAIRYMLSINWMPRAPKLPPLDTIKMQLDREFYGLESVKKRVLEIAAQVRRTGTLPHWGVLLNGPAGVGKTTIARAIANVMGLPLVVLDLSTTNDAEGLVGSSRIYGNAKPGAIVEKLMEIRDSNCVFLLNEIDKATGGKDRGNPADTLLTLVDKLGFIDTFMETTIDTRNIFFLATCNNIDNISKPLQDRFLRIDIDRYSKEEKKIIFSRHVFPRALAAANISDDEIEVTDDFVDELCRFYATEPGVRDLEQYAERIVGDYLLSVETQELNSKVYSKDDLPVLLGARPGFKQTLLAGPGIAKSIYLLNGQAGIALIQAVYRPGTGNLCVVGASSEFHRDCFRAAYECARTISGINFNAIDITVYTPSILPSTGENYIGCAAFMAIMSAVTGKCIPGSAVFLGGCDLFGNILWSGDDITPIIERMEQGGETCLYGPTSLSDCTFQARDVRVIQSYSAGFLFEIAEYTI